MWDPTDWVSDRFIWRKECENKEAVRNMFVLNRNKIEDLRFGEKKSKKLRRFPLACLSHCSENHVLMLFYYELNAETFINVTV